LRRDRKTARDGAEVTETGRVFQKRLPITGKARSPTVLSLVRLTAKSDDDDDRRRRRFMSTTRWK